MDDDWNQPTRTTPLRALLGKRAAPGTLTFIGLRPALLAEVEVVQEAELIEDHGLRGDRAGEQRGGRRQVSLLQEEHLGVIASLVRRQEVRPEELRRNLVVRGINLLALRARVFRVGEALLEGTGTCSPCSKMERALGPGGYNALRGHGGILARVVRGGIIRVGDEVDFD